jgi:integrase
MGHSNVKTTEIYTHVMEKNLDAVLSPLDILDREKQEHDLLSK